MLFVKMKKYLSLLFFFIIVVSFCIANQVDSLAENPINVTDKWNRNQIELIKTINYDMTAPHEGNPKGVSTSIEWATSPRINMGNDPWEFKAIIAWGHLYEDDSGNPATNTRVQIKEIKAYMLSKRDGKWHLLQSSKKVEGAAYRADYANNESKPADIRYEKDGSISVKAGQGYNFHFWTPRRSNIDPTDIAGIVTSVRARLIVNNPQQPDDRSKARYLLGMGGDYWRDQTAQWNKSWTNNADIGIGKFKYVKPWWRYFTMTTLSPTEICQNPPPVDRAMSTD
ncbi:hypothetical protein [Myxosarcina sp. GI1(2024)]